MPLFFSASVGPVSGRIAFVSIHFPSEATALTNPSAPYSSSPHLAVASRNGILGSPCFLYSCYSAKKRAPTFAPNAVVSGADATDKADGVEDRSPSSPDDFRQARRSADWKAARVYKERGLIFEGRVEDFNSGGLLIRFYSLVGFLPYPQLSPKHACKELGMQTRRALPSFWVNIFQHTFFTSHGRETLSSPHLQPFSCAEPHRPIQEVAEGLTGSIVSVKVIVADEENKKLIFSEKEAAWSKFSQQINVGDVFQGRVGSIEDYGAFVHLKFPDGCYNLTGLVHVSEVSWDLVQDVRDILTEGDEVRVKIINMDRLRSRITLSMKQLEEDPLLETLEKVIPQEDAALTDYANQGYEIEPLPGLETIFQGLLQEEGIEDVKITRQGFEKRVVSQDLQLWLSNVPPIGNQFTLLARAGRQEIQLTTSLDQDGIKSALQCVLERVP